MTGLSSVSSMQSQSASFLQKEMFQRIDTDGSGSISKEEFVVNRPDDVTEEMAANLFSEIDTGADGFLSKTEMSAIQPLSGVTSQSGSSEEDEVSALSSDLDLSSLLSLLEGDDTEETSSTSTLLELLSANNETMMEGETSETSSLQSLTDAISAYRASAAIYSSAQSDLASSFLETI